MTRLPRIRIESDQDVVTNAKIWLLDDGFETDISRCVTGVDVHLHVGEPARATLHTIAIDGHITADLTNVIMNRIRPPRRRFWRLRK